MRNVLCIEPRYTRTAACTGKVLVQSETASKESGDTADEENKQQTIKTERDSLTAFFDDGDDDDIVGGTPTFRHGKLLLLMQSKSLRFIRRCPGDDCYAHHKHRYDGRSLPGSGQYGALLEQGDCVVRRRACLSLEDSRYLLQRHRLLFRCRCAPRARVLLCEGSCYCQSRLMSLLVISISSGVLMKQLD